MTPQSSPQLNDADLELLSAYLDQQVTEEERLLIETRLQQEPALQSALAELRTTVAMLHELTPLTPPRSFTLDPAVAQPRRSGLVVWLRLGSVLCVLMLAVTMTFEFISSGGSYSAAPAEPPLAPGAVMDEQPMMTEEALQEVAPEARGAAPELQMAPEEGGEGITEDHAATGGDSIAQQQTQPSALELVQPSPELEAAAEEIAPSENFKAGSTELDQPAFATEAPPAPPAITAIRIIQMALGVLALTLALLAVLLGRRRQV